MVGSNAIRALVVDDDLSLIGEYRRILSAGSERPSESDDLFCALDGELIGAVINHKQFPAVDLAEYRLGQDAVEAVRDGHETGRGRTPWECGLWRARSNNGALQSLQGQLMTGARLERGRLSALIWV